MDGAVVLNWGSDTIKAGQLSRFPSDSEPYVVRHGFASLWPPPSHTALVLSTVQTNLCRRCNA